MKYKHSIVRELKNNNGMYASQLAMRVSTVDKDFDEALRNVWDMVASGELKIDTDRKISLW